MLGGVGFRRPSEMAVANSSGEQRDTYRLVRHADKRERKKSCREINKDYAIYHGAGDKEIPESSSDLVAISRTFHFLRNQYKD